MKIHLKDCKYISGCNWTTDDIQYMLYKEYSEKEKQITEDIELYANTMDGIPYRVRTIQKDDAVQLLKKII